MVKTTKDETNFINLVSRMRTISKVLFKVNSLFIFLFIFVYFQFNFELNLLF